MEIGIYMHGRPPRAEKNGTAAVSSEWLRHILCAHTLRSFIPAPVAFMGAMWPPSGRCALCLYPRGRPGAGLRR
eukprot:scaffold5866_cov93-Isochrysis_galbana.AAC.11